MKKKKAKKKSSSSGDPRVHNQTTQKMEVHLHPTVDSGNEADKSLSKLMSARR